MPSNLSELDWRTHQGQHSLCDLQGGGYDTHYVLTDPAVLSMKQEFGATDGGKKNDAEPRATTRAVSNCQHKYGSGNMW